MFCILEIHAFDSGLSGVGAVPQPVETKETGEGHRPGGAEGRWQGCARCHHAAWKAEGRVRRHVGLPGAKARRLGLGWGVGIWGEQEDAGSGRVGPCDGSS